MPPFRIPGCLSAAKEQPIDSGTAIRIASPTPSFFGRVFGNPLYHEYEHKTVLCDAKQFSREATFQLFLSNARFVAPTDDTRPVVDGITINVYLAIFGVRFRENNPIRTTVDAKNYSITNTTQPGHLLHPGTVVRRIIEEDGKIAVHTNGVGTGIVQGSLNILDSLPGSSPLNRLLPRQMRPSGIANDLAAADVWGRVDAGFKVIIERQIVYRPSTGIFGGGGEPGVGFGDLGKIGR